MLAVVRVKTGMGEVVDLPQERIGIGQPDLNAAQLPGLARSPTGWSIARANTATTSATSLTYFGLIDGNSDFRFADVAGSSFQHPTLPGGCDLPARGR